MKKISIIIPVYNAEKTLEKCLNSIMDSKYENYEIILIDDGSTDNSASIISNYANKNNRIKLVSQPNFGPSEARNRGLKLAEGDIISFVDSDDYVRDDYLEQLAKVFDEENADVVFFEFCCVNFKGNKLSRNSLPKIKTEYYENLIALSKTDTFGYTWIKAFRKEIAFGIYFDVNQNLYEDEIFTCQLLAKPVRLYYLREAIYFYVISVGSLMQRTHEDYCQLCDSVYYAWERLLDKMPKKNFFLEEKANHMAQACKYYGLEKKVNPFHFYRDMASCEFMKVSSDCDPFIIAIKKKKWCAISWMYLIYHIKIRIAKYMRKKNNEEII